MPKFLRKLKAWIGPIPVLHLVFDLILLTASLYLSMWLRLGSEQFAEYRPLLQAFLPIYLAARLLTLLLSGVYYAMWRYYSAQDVTRLVRALGLSTLIMLSLTYFLIDWGRVPRSVFFIDFLTATALLLSLRIGRRRYFEWQHKVAASELPTRRVLIVGAGNSGRFLVQRLLTEKSRGMVVCGLIDDDPHKIGRIINGIEVFGPIAELPYLIDRMGLQDILIAPDQQDTAMIKTVVAMARAKGVLAKIADLAVGPQRLPTLRELNLEDLIQRSTQVVQVKLLREAIEGKVVLITGAGGSIGSEIARQVLRLEPKKLLLLDHSEYLLYEVDSALSTLAMDRECLVPLLIDIKDKMSLSQIFTTHAPDIVFHAAAYKHVHLVEANVSAAILNNILGTKNLLELAAANSVSQFVLISTDKAVNPVGAMGATKRVCEMLTAHFGLKTQRNFCSVRFGNVAGSSGSLIPLLKKQIETGGPITITHPDMTRFFMLIPEAVSLVLCAATLSKPGDIQVLKMGKPLKIVDVAKDLLLMMGKSEQEIPIVFTGPRPGEKLFEELYLNGSEIETSHPDILTLPKGDLSLDEQKGDSNLFIDRVEHLIHSAEAGVHTTRSELMALIATNT